MFEDELERGQKSSVDTVEAEKAVISSGLGSSFPWPCKSDETEGEACSCG